MIVQLIFQTSNALPIEGSVYIRIVLCYGSLFALLLVLMLLPTAIFVFLLFHLPLQGQVFHRSVLRHHMSSVLQWQQPGNTLFPQNPCCYETLVILSCGHWVALNTAKAKI